MIKRRAFLFPYTLNNCEIIKFKDLLVNMDIVGVDSLTKELRGKDVSYIYNGSNQGINIGDETIDYDVLLLGDGSRIGDEFDKIYEYAERAAQKGKNIFILYILTRKQREKFEKLCKDNNVGCRIFSGLEVPDKIMNCEYEILNDISIPVIIVSGVAENTRKFEIQLFLNKYFKSAGYNVVQIGSKNFSELFGFYSFPQFMFCDISEAKKIICFNELCKGLEYQEKPDLFIIGVPGSLIPYNNYFTNKFGIFSFEIGKAIKADAVVMALDNAPYEVEGIANINNICRVYFGNEATVFSISNFRIDVEKSIQEKILGYIISNKENVDKNVKRLKERVKIPVFNLLDYIQLQKLAEYIENDLSDMDIKLL